MTIFSTMRRAGIPVLAYLLALPALADGPGGLVTGSFGDQPLELTVVPELSGATIIGNYADASLLAAQMEGDQGPVNLELTINGELPSPGEIALTITFARDMGQNWTGDQDSLTLTLEEFTPGDGIVALKGTLTGQVSGGPTSETRPVTFSFDTRLEELD
ncbi:hypothetical protein OF122_02360 [Pelagibacterium flavum]|uniref:DUF4402 domain-containing protein n=1 Tax=Pelagibacterium flavum TaxID=2984530 RepID=A0ABY6IPW7_9HYPH|nr:hypothetical protein [Pelagibacterium sp. YIM 151497]UYQ72648.1 hypothetical protein OF122_02360 [Pelagibacterium sp. YIM 151497]